MLPISRAMSWQLIGNTGLYAKCYFATELLLASPENGLPREWQWGLELALPIPRLSKFVIWGLSQGFSGFLSCWLIGADIHSFKLIYIFLMIQFYSKIIFLMWTIFCSLFCILCTFNQLQRNYKLTLLFAASVLVWVEPSSFFIHYAFALSLHCASDFSLSYLLSSRTNFPRLVKKLESRRDSNPGRLSIHGSIH